ncbi:GreA/GreB family elongation factor [Bradyrhizobium sp. SEMIA]|uniref:GreA/GreB family elongation factor n=1 Tax=Bradyrhizobium sp. SEMIA TaxID=2597515 RepID=UPI0018A4C693|nr:GreA/GreB family elongation factor [Bradyrhizobium sp. SEMIA]QOG16338.1 hypothetical protein FOM02_02250 [Bradyrhizobium sp. SEMIA]
MRKGCQRSIQIVSRDRLVPEIVKHAPGRFEHAGVIVHNKDVLPCAYRWSTQLPIFASPEADAARGKISVSSPLARALISRSQGAVVAVETPGGEKSYKIEQVRWLP